MNSEGSKETKEEFLINRLAYALGLKNATSQDKFKKSIETEDNKFNGFLNQENF